MDRNYMQRSMHLTDISFQSTLLRVSKRANERITVTERAIEVSSVEKTKLVSDVSDASELLYSIVYLPRGSEEETRYL